MNKVVNLMLVFTILSGLLPLALSAESSQTVGTYSARLRIDNFIQLEWEGIPSGGTRLKIYGIENEDDENIIPVSDNVPIGDRVYVFDFLAAGVQYSDYYVFELYGGGDTLIETSIVETSFFVKRRGKEILNVEHPYMMATPQLIEETKEKIESHTFYKTIFNTLIKNCDELLVTYEILPEKIEVAPYYLPTSQAGKYATAVSHLGTAYGLTKNKAYAELATRILKVFVDNYAVVNNLFTQVVDDSLIVSELAEGYDMIHEAVTPEDRKIIEEGYFRLIAERINNTPRGIMRGMGKMDWALADIGILLKDEEILNIAWGDSQNNRGLLHSAVNGIGDDGFWWEQAMSYHNSRLGYYMMTAEYFYNSGYDLYEHDWVGQRNSQNRGRGYLVRNNPEARKHVDSKKIKELYDPLFNYLMSDLSYPTIGDTVYGQTIFRVPTELFERGWARYNDPRCEWVLYNKFGQDRRNIGTIEPRLLFLSKPEISREPLIIGNDRFNIMGYNRFGSTLMQDVGLGIFRHSGGEYEDSASLAFTWSGLGTTGHSNADKLSILYSAKGADILIDPGRYTYYNIPRQEFAKHTIAHNTVAVDELNQAPYPSNSGSGSSAEFLADSDTQFTGGIMTNGSVGPYSKVIQMRNDEIYRDLGVSANRTLWMIDDYVIDAFGLEGVTERQYDWPLTVNGELTSLSVSSKERADQNQPLGNTLGYMHIKNLVDANPSNGIWTGEWNIKEDVDFKLTMLGGEDTQIIRGKGIADKNSADLYDREMIIARRNAVNTTFVSVLDATNDGVFRKVTPISVSNSSGEKVYAAKIEREDNIPIDTFIVSKSTSDKKVNGIETDAQSAFRRQYGMNDIALGIIHGTRIQGRQVGIQLSVNNSIQLSKLADNCWRLDMGEKNDPAVSLRGFDGYDIYSMTQDNQGTLTLLEQGPESFPAEKTGIYIISRNGAHESVDLSYHIVMTNEAFENTFDMADPHVMKSIPEMPDGIIVEAEDFIRETGGNARIERRDMCVSSTNNSEGNMISRWDDANHRLEWTVTVPKAGKYKMALRYATITAGYRTIEIDGNQPVTFSIDVTAGWSDFANALIETPLHEDMLFELKEGENNVLMNNISGSALNLDYFVFIPVE